jgi:GTPase involved in cell partitioning and DNA repair
MIFKVSYLNIWNHALQGFILTIATSNNPLFLQASKTKENNDQARKSLQCIYKGKETFASFLMERQFNIIVNKIDEMRLHLMKCLRYRLSLQLDSNKNEISSTKEKLFRSKKNCFDFVSFLDKSGNGSSSIFNSNSAHSQLSIQFS